MSDASVQPINQSPIPVGSVAEAEKHNLDPAVYATCSRPGQMHNGCSWNHKCRVSARGVDGPHFYGVEIMHGPNQDGSFARSTVDCMWIADHAGDIEANRGSLRVVANEGEEYEKVSTVAVNNLTGEVTSNKKDPTAGRQERRIKVLVPKWPRPGENKELVSDMLRAEIMEAERERRTSDNFARNIGLESTVAPLDKRDAGRHEGHSKAGGASAKG